MKKGVVLINMGGAESPLQLRDFLFKMFIDKHIIGAPKLIRYILAYFISRRRYKNSWKKYEMIGGTPILKAGKEMALELAKLTNLPVEIAYSYTKPYISDGINNLMNKGVDNINVIPLYPQASYTTTSSVLVDIKKLEKKYKSKRFNFVNEFYDSEKFLSYWTQLISDHIAEKKYKKPVLLFAAHSIPQSIVDKGDTYIFAIEKNAKQLAEKLEYDFAVSYQSKFGPVKWYGKDTKEVIHDLVSKSETEIIIIPISFISECLETIYDIDKELFTELEKELPNNIKYSRIIIPYAHPLLIETFKSLLKWK